MNTIFDKVAIERCCDDFFSLYDVTRERTRDMCHAKRVHTHAVAENCIYLAKNSGLIRAGGRHADFSQQRQIQSRAFRRTHSDFKLPPDLTDCIDIFRSIVTSGCQTHYNCNKEEILSTDISPAIEEAFQRRQTVKHSDRVTLADRRMAHIALCFVLKSSAARRRALEQGYLQNLMDIEFFDPPVQAKFVRAKIIVEEFMAHNEEV